MNSINECKSSLKQILHRHQGDTSHPQVQDIVSKLLFLATDEKTNVEQSDTITNPGKYTGRWRTISSPPFPGRLDDVDGKAAYTLGRMSFNLFRPNKIVCIVEDIVNVVEPLDVDNKNTGVWEQCYNLEVTMELLVPCNDDADAFIRLPAKIINFGVCSPSSPSRLAVKFTGGVLKPTFDLNKQENQDLARTWRQTFDGVISRETKEMPILDKMTTSISYLVMKIMMGMSPPVDNEDLTQTYDIARPISGYLDILYISDDLRISKGNRGTIVVVEKI